MKSPVRIGLFLAVLVLVLGAASVAVAAPTLAPGLGYSDGPHGSTYPGLCTGCHTFQVWPAPVITQGATPGHGPRGTTCTQCHVVQALPPADIAVPTVVAATFSNAEISVGWTAVPDAVSYRVFRSAAVGGPFTQIASTTGLSYNDTARAAGTRYYYEVKGVDSTGAFGPANTPVSARTYKAATIRVDSSLPQLTTSSGWITRSYSKYYGGTTRSASAAGKKITVPFRGTAITWYGSKGKGFGKATVKVDGKLVKTIDLYSAGALYNKALVTKSGLSDTSHSLVITVLAAKNAKAIGRRVDVDSFGITGLTPGLNQEEAKAVFAGSWSSMSSTSYSASACRASQSTTGTASYTFTGTGCTWLATKSTGRGSAQVLVDGVLKGAVDLWAAHTGYRKPAYAIAGLPRGVHKIEIVPTGEHNAVSGGSLVDVDAFVTR